MRLFIAILLDDAVKNGICSVMETIRAHAVRGNFTRRENLHLTLIFLGETEREKLPVLQSAMEEAAGEPFSLEFCGLGYFCRREGPLYYLEAHGNSALSALQTRLKEALFSRGFQMEGKAFRPHLTLGRTVVLEREFSTAGILPHLPEQLVSGFCLMESKRAAGRLVYTRLLEVPLHK
ncbi:MAG: RNA 2',3'-cyclic phosphodiesterase [Oscillospiraceae bacterium]|nr:RNA 2',3'-cyclic phosphodiesterase [Oscillospiraceae bacterium]